MSRKVLRQTLSFLKTGPFPLESGRQDVSQHLHQPQREDPEGQAYLKAIVAGLAPSYDVWVDEKRLEAGDDWGLVIANQFVECHGAVALFSTQALHSEYFRFEVDNLFARWMREGHDRVGTAAGGKFRFCLLLVPPLDVKRELVAQIPLDTVGGDHCTNPESKVAKAHLASTPARSARRSRASAL